MADRAKNQVVILHGWSDTSDSFAPLANFLEDRDFRVLDLFLADYLSMDDDVSIEDAAKAMQSAVEARIASAELKPPFDLIVHSTGGLVARTWLAAYCAGMKPAQMPVQRLVMIAPANFGSALADVGQTILGRVVKGWDHGFHTGKLMLDGLALGSPFQWDLAARDLFADGSFLEVFVDTPIEECERRDPKGHYKKARAGEIGEFTGISAPYEPQLNPEITIHTQRDSEADCVATMLSYLEARGYIAPA